MGPGIVKCKAAKASSHCLKSKPDTNPERSFSSLEFQGQILNGCESLICNRCGSGPSYFWLVWARRQQLSFAADTGSLCWKKQFSWVLQRSHGVNVDHGVYHSYVHLLNNGTLLHVQNAASVTDRWHQHSEMNIVSMFWYCQIYQIDSKNFH